jgi:NitT/TauT family transport system substrate-binding protein
VAATYPDRVQTSTGVHLLEREFAKHYDLVEGSRTLARLSIDASTGGQQLMRRLGEDQLDLSFGGVPALLVQIDQGAPIRLLAPVMTEGAGLVISNALPVRTWAEFLDHARQPRDEPLRIGYKAELSVQNLVFEQQLADAGISFAYSLDATGVEILLVNLSGAQHLVPALQHRLVDGFVSMQPYLALAEAGGSGRLVTLLSGMTDAVSGRGYPCCAIAARTAALAAHREIIASFVDLMQVATEFIRNEPELSADAVSAWLGTTPEIERRSLPTTRFSMERDTDWDQGVLQWCGWMQPPGLLSSALGGGATDAALLDSVYAAPAANPQEPLHE